MMNLPELGLDVDLEDVRVSTDSQEVFGLDVTVCVIREPTTSGALN